MSGIKNNADDSYSLSVYTQFTLFPMAMQGDDEM